MPSPTLIIKLLKQGDLVHLFNNREHRLAVAIPEERALVALIRGQPVGYVLWACYVPGDGPMPWMTVAYAFLFSAWTTESRRRSGICSALMSALAQEMAERDLYGMTMDPAIEHLLQRYGPGR